MLTGSLTAKRRPSSWAHSATRFCLGAEPGPRKDGEESPTALRQANALRTNTSPPEKSRRAKRPRAWTPRDRVVNRGGRDAAMGIATIRGDLQPWSVSRCPRQRSLGLRGRLLLARAGALSGSPGRERQRAVHSQRARLAASAVLLLTRRPHPGSVPGRPAASSVVHSGKAARGRP